MKNILIVAVLALLVCLCTVDVHAGGGRFLSVNVGHSHGFGGNAVILDAGHHHGFNSFNSFNSFSVRSGCNNNQAVFFNNNHGFSRRNAVILKNRGFSNRSFRGAGFGGNVIINVDD